MRHRHGKEVEELRHEPTHQIYPSIPCRVFSGLIDMIAGSRQGTRSSSVQSNPSLDVRIKEDSYGMSMSLIISLANGS